MTGTQYPHRDEIISGIESVRGVLITLISEKPYDNNKGFAVSHISDAYKDLVQSLCMLDDNDRRNETLGSELGSLAEMKKSLMASLSDIAEAVEPNKTEYVEEVVDASE